MSKQSQAVAALRALLQGPGFLLMPCCHDAFSAKLVEQGKTPLLAPDRLREIGYRIAAYPLTLLSAAACAMREALAHGA